MSDTTRPTFTQFTYLSLVSYDSSYFLLKGMKAFGAAEDRQIAYLIESNEQILHDGYGLET